MFDCALDASSAFRRSPVSCRALYRRRELWSDLMATQTRTQARSEEQAAVQTDAPEKDSPLLDLSDAAVKRFIKTAKARGYVTYDELNAVLPSEEVSSEQ